MLISKIIIFMAAHYCNESCSWNQVVKVLVLDI